MCLVNTEIADMTIYPRNKYRDFFFITPAEGAFYTGFFGAHEAYL
jgi:hypothetical protein